MNLRSKLVLALIVAALLPTLVVVGVPLLRAPRLAAQEEAERLALARHQALVLVERHAQDTLGRVAAAAAALLDDPRARDVPLQGPETRARAIATALAERHGLERVEILDAEGTRLAASSGAAMIGAASALAEVAPGDVVLRSRAADVERPAHVAAAALSLGAERCTLVGQRALGSSLLAGIGEITEQPVALLDPAGEIVDRGGPPRDASATRSTIVPLGDGSWALRVAVAPSDVARVRRELWVVLAGVAPLALASALIVGALLAHGISRPIRELADRAERIAAEAAAPSPATPERDEVRRLTAAFDTMLEALGASERRRVGAERIAAWQDVARRIAHEVKNPLSPIRLAVENLRRTRQKAPQELDRALDEETAVILEEVDGLRRLVDEFERFARLPAPQPVRCDLRQVVAQALSLFAARSSALGAEVVFDAAAPPLWAEVDPEQIGRVLKNVLANALDALEPVRDRRLWVTLRRPEGPHDAEIEVRDSGAGFEPEALARVFEPYFTTRGDRGGTGLGMAIAHRIVTEHGGTIRAHGAPGRGATVTLRLPVVARSVAHAARV